VRKNFRNLGPEIPSAGFSGTIQQTLVWWSLGLPDLFCHPCWFNTQHM